MQFLSNTTVIKHCGRALAPATWILKMRLGSKNDKLTLRLGNFADYRLKMVYFRDFIENVHCLHADFFTSGRLAHEIPS